MTEHKIPRRPFCLIRHGETDANRKGIIAGRLEAQLTALGQAQACKIATLRWNRLLLFSSPQNRAVETAFLAFPGVEATQIPDLRERDWGNLEGQPLSAMIPRRDTPENGEAWQDMLLRTQRGLMHALLDPRVGLPVLVAHSGTIRAIRHLTGGTEHGLRPPNAAPLFFTPVAEGWQESMRRPKRQGAFD
ncbi:MAG: histidine phosphatase family protein [Rhodobacteraceae bacterium]|nr:histidine phosphatase family protein [Paracoccaceae bacterium]